MTSELWGIFQRDDRPLASHKSWKVGPHRRKMSGVGVAYGVNCKADKLVDGNREKGVGAFDRDIFLETLLALFWHFSICLFSTHAANAHTLLFTPAPLPPHTSSTQSEFPTFAGMELRVITM